MKRSTIFSVLVFVMSGIHLAVAVKEFWPTSEEPQSESTSKFSSFTSSKTPSPSPKTHKPSHSSASVSSSGSGSSSSASVSSSGSGSSSSGLTSLSGSSSGLMYACVCSDLRKVSLMGASNYCLFPDAYVDNKCGNVNVAEDGECPRAGAQPCSDMGHVLMSDSICTKVSGIYKCVASTADVKAQKQSKKKKKSSKKSNSSGSGSSTGSVIVRSSDAARSTLEAVALALSMVAGVVLLL